MGGTTKIERMAERGSEKMGCQDQIIGKGVGFSSSIKHLSH